MSKTAHSNYVNSVNLNSQSAFPYLVLDATNKGIYPRNPGFKVMHWHIDLQFIYSITGTVRVKTLDNELLIHQGEGLFINKSVLHFVEPVGICHYKSFIFPEYFLNFYPDNPTNHLTKEIIYKKQLSYIHLVPEIIWQHNIILHLQKLTALEQAKNELYPYEVLTNLTSIWLIMLKNISQTPIKKETPAQLRMQKFLEFIEEHYMNELSLEELAASANVSKSECLRCFKTIMQTTPYKYLLELRLHKAAELLKNTNLPIAAVAEHTGFNQTSHFGKCFREKTGSTPLQYRRNT